MSLRFSTFRRILLGLIASISCVCIGLVTSILQSLKHGNVFWMVVFIETACALRSLWSCFRKYFLKHHQSVGSETIGLFFLLPFELVLTLITAMCPLVRERTSNSVPFVLQIFILVNTIINLSYSACLLLTALVTSAAFDSDIWTRDIDSSPSPFPITVLLKFAFPFLGRYLATPAFTMSLVHEPVGPQSSICLPGCVCNNKGDIGIESSPEEPPPVQSRHVSLSRSLVRVPNAVERRLSIAVAFEV